MSLDKGTGYKTWNGTEYQNDNYGNGEVNEYSGNYKCDSNSRVTFASSDVHDGPRTDISFLLLSMNHSFVHLGPRNATTNYPQGKLGLILMWTLCQALRNSNWLILSSVLYTLVYLFFLFS